MRPILTQTYREATITLLRADGLYQASVVDHAHDDAVIDGDWVPGRRTALDDARCTVDEIREDPAAFYE